MSFGDVAPASAIASATSALQLLVGQLGRQVGGDQLGLGLLVGDEVVAARRRGTARRRRGGACARGAGCRPRRRCPPSRAFCSSERTRRRRPTRSFSPARIAAARSSFTLSASVTAIQCTAVVPPDEWASSSLPGRRVERRRAAELPQLGEVAAEQQADVPVDEQARLAAHAGHREQVVGAGEQPRRRAAPLDPERRRDGLAPPEVDERAERLVAERLRSSRCRSPRRRCARRCGPGAASAGTSAASAACSSSRGRGPPRSRRSPRRCRARRPACSESTSMRPRS